MPVVVVTKNLLAHLLEGYQFKTKHIQHILPLSDTTFSKSLLTINKEVKVYSAGGLPNIHSSFVFPTVPFRDTVGLTQNAHVPSMSYCYRSLKVLASEAVWDPIMGTVPSSLSCFFYPSYFVALDAAWPLTVGTT